MEVKPALALPEGLEVTTIEMIKGVLTITAVSSQLFPCCPLCDTKATRVHSRYTRRLADLPCGGQQVRLLVQVRKCFCDAPNCPRKIFVEPPDALRGHLCAGNTAFVSDRAGHWPSDGWQAWCPCHGSRYRIQTSRQTILRRIMVLPTEPVGQVPQIGIDDFSFRRGRKFGTIIVDLRTRHPS